MGGGKETDQGWIKVQLSTDPRGPNAGAARGNANPSKGFRSKPRQIFPSRKPAADHSLIKNPGTPLDWKGLFNNPVNHDRKLNFVPPTVIGGEKAACLSSAALALADQKWRHTLIGYVLDRLPFLPHLKASVIRQWKPKASLNIYSRENGFFVFQFGCDEDCNVALEQGPWFFDGRLIVLKKWSASTGMDRDILRSVPVWVRLPELPLRAWTTSSIETIASVIGIPLLMDNQTASTSRIDYARCLVEIAADSEPRRLITVFLDDGSLFAQPVEYEWLPPRCSHCSIFGHLDKECTSVEKQEVPPPNPPCEDVDAFGLVSEPSAPIVGCSLILSGSGTATLPFLSDCSALESASKIATSSALKSPSTTCAMTAPTASPSNSTNDVLPNSSTAKVEGELVLSPEVPSNQQVSLPSDPILISVPIISETVYSSKLVKAMPVELSSQQGASPCSSKALSSSSDAMGPPLQVSAGGSTQYASSQVVQGLMLNSSDCGSSESLLSRPVDPGLAASPTLTAPVDSISKPTTFTLGSPVVPGIAPSINLVTSNNLVKVAHNDFALENQLDFKSFTMNNPEWILAMQRGKSKKEGQSIPTQSKKFKGLVVGSKSTRRL